MSYTFNPNLQERKLEWDPTIPIDFPETDRISNDINCNMLDLIVWNGNPLTYHYLKTLSEGQRDEIAKDLLNFFLKYDFMKYQQEPQSIERHWKKLCKSKTLKLNKNNELDNISRLGDKIYKYFFPNILKIRSGNRKSVYDSITNKETLFKIIRNRVGNTLLYNTKNRTPRQWPMNITPAMIIQGAKSSGVASMGSIFKPIVAKTIYSHHVQDNQNVLDYSCGFGTRLLGLMSCGFKNVHYYGYEPNTETYLGLQKMANYLEFNDRAHIECKGSEEISLDIPIHFAFSSPCYHNVEIYSDEETQCYNKYPDYNEWLEKYWRKTVKNIKNCLVSDGIFAVNIGNTSNERMQQLSNDFNDIILAEGFKLKDVWWMKTNKSHLSNKKITQEITKQEGIYFYGFK
jgi:hypothetical protein